MDLLRQQASQLGAATALTFLADGEREAASLTYEELDLRARAIAAHLQHQGLAGQRLMLLFPSGLDFMAAFFGCLYAGAVPVPALPPRHNRNLHRLQRILADAQPALALSSGIGFSRKDMVPELANLPWLDPGGVADTLAAAWTPPAIAPTDLAFLQYTSGSTSQPKGVMLSHQNLLANHAMMRDVTFSGREDTMVVWMPLYHDLGLIGNVLQSLHQGGRCVIMPPETFIIKPVRWLQAISRYRARISGGPNFSYDLCVRKITPEQAQSLDLSSWQAAYNGAEPVREETMIRFADHFRSSGFEVTRFFPCYGLAEATLLVTTSRASDPLKVLPSPSAPADAVAAAPARAACGKAWAPGEVLVVDPESRLPCPPGTTGEIWVAGPHVAMGYWQQPEETTRTFRARPASPAGEERYFLRTGDLGFLWNEELYIDGRLKDLIIVGGQNHHPNDIEETVQQSHPMVHPRGSAAFSVTRNGQEELIVLAELDRKAILRSVTAPADLPAALTELKFAVHHAVRKEIAEQHALTVREIVFLNPSAIPKTTSGKVQRHAAREAYLLGTLDTVL